MLEYVNRFYRLEQWKFTERFAFTVYSQSTPTPMLRDTKGLKPELPSCYRQYGSFSCEFTLDKGQRGSARALISLQWRQIFSFLCFCEPRTKLCSPEAWVELGREKSLFPRLFFTKSCLKVKMTLILLIPPAFSSFLPRNPLCHTELCFICQAVMMNIWLSPHQSEQVQTHFGL